MRRAASSSHGLIIISRARAMRRRALEVEGFWQLQFDHELEMGGLLNWQVAGLCA
jgi:hypothetical protein